MSDKVADKAAALARARRMMDAHGLADWTVRWSRARRTFGQCIHAQRVIRLSWPITRLNDHETFEATVLHEIAHALAGPTGHGAAWRRVCARLGIDDARCFDPAEVAVPPANWIGTCPTCGWTTTRVQLRATTRTGSCPRCDRRHNPAHRLQWERMVALPGPPAG